MEHIQWCQNMLKDREGQTLLEEKVQLLIDQFLKRKASDYAIEKFIKSFGEGIMYLENSMLKDRGIHPSQMEENMVYLSTHPEETAKKMKEVTDTLKVEINRQYRHFNRFLSEICS